MNLGAIISAESSWGWQSSVNKEWLMIEKTQCKKKNMLLNTGTREVRPVCTSGPGQMRVPLWSGATPVKIWEGIMSMCVKAAFNRAQKDFFLLAELVLSTRWSVCFLHPSWLTLDTGALFSLFRHPGESPSSIIFSAHKSLSLLEGVCSHIAVRT